MVVAWCAFLNLALTANLALGPIAPRRSRNDSGLPRSGTRQTRSGSCGGRSGNDFTSKIKAKIRELVRGQWCVKYHDFRRSDRRFPQSFENDDGHPQQTTPRPTMQNTSGPDTPRSVGWICTDPSLFATAKAMLDIEHIDSSVKHDNDDVYSGRIGTVNVVINCMPPPLHSANIAVAAQSMIASPMDIKSLLITGATSDLVNINPGDLIINPLTDRDEDHSESISTRKWSLSQQAAILQREVGDEGRWLSSNFSPAALGSSDPLAFTQRPDGVATKYPRLRYENLSQDSQNSHRKEMVAAKSVPDFNAVAEGFRAGASSRIIADSIAALENLPVDVVIILAAGRYDGSSDYAAANAASYAKELIRGMSDGLTNSIASLRGTETIVPPHLDIKVPPFEPQPFPRHGEAVFLVIPTANKSKGRLLREAFENQKPKDVVMHSIAVPFDSGVGEQPYNEAGVLGAHTRVSNALRYLNAPEHQEALVSKGIGTVIVASIENYIQLGNVGRPTDYGVVVIHNATAGETAAGLSWGVTVPPGYVDGARRFGFEGNPNHGRVTVGKILAAHVPGLDEADWHSVLAGRSRYDLLSDTISRLTIPW
jgi:hypothetical protein